MQLKRAIERIPGGLMVVPLLCGALLNTLDQAHFPAVEDALRGLGVKAHVEMNPATGKPKEVDPETGKPIEHYELLRVGGFASALFKDGAFCLIGMFLVCVGAQMDFRVGGRALKKGAIVAFAKIASAIAVGYLIGMLTDPFNGLLGLSIMTIIAAMSNGNGGMYAALTGQYGNRSDVGALSMISLEFGPLMTMIALGLLSQGEFPLAYFLGVLVPMGLGFVLGQIDDDIRKFLRPGESLLVPFFAFALGANMNLAVFGKLDVLAGGLFLAVATVVCTGVSAAVLLRLFGERSQIAAVAEASTSGNAMQTPAYVAVAAAGAVRSALDAAAQDPTNLDLAARLSHLQALADRYAEMQNIAMAQISISTVTTALLCPLVVIFYDRWQRRRGIDGKQEDP